MRQYLMFTCTYFDDDIILLSFQLFNRATILDSTTPASRRRGNVELVPLSSIVCISQEKLLMTIDDLQKPPLKFHSGTTSVGPAGKKNEWGRKKGEKCIYKESYPWETRKRSAMHKRLPIQSRAAREKLKFLSEACVAERLSRIA